MSISGGKSVKIDAGTIYGFAAVSLLTGTVECTQPTELEEIEKRAEDIRDMLGDIELVYGNNSYFPFFADGKWPFATTQEDLEKAALDWASQYRHEDREEDVDVGSLIEVLKKEEIESKYRLSIVKKDVMRKVLMPF
jgi:hypothetical protein